MSAEWEHKLGLKEIVQVPGVQFTFRQLPKQVQTITVARRAQPTRPGHRKKEKNRIVHDSRGMTRQSHT